MTVWHEKQRIAWFDESYKYKGYVLVNELIEDSDGFYKNSWMWGKEDGEHVLEVIELEGLTSNSYSNFSEAHKVFTQLMDEITSN